MFLLLALAYKWIAWHIPPLIPFYTINNISILAKRSSYTLVFFKAAYQAHKFHNAHFEIFEIHQLTIIHHFQHINHDILLNFLFQNLYTLFFWVHSLHQLCSFVNNFIFFFLKLTISIACSLKDLQNFFMQALRLHASCLFFTLLNDDMMTFKNCMNNKWRFIRFLVMIMPFFSVWNHQKNDLFFTIWLMHAGYIFFIFSMQNIRAIVRLFFWNFFISSFFWWVIYFFPVIFL